jgi:hypothetical protein
MLDFLSLPRGIITFLELSRALSDVLEIFYDDLLSTFRVETGSCFL